jgi:nucleoid DNA-binding protein
VGGMKKNDIAYQLARRSRLTRAEAADQVDHVLHEILSELKQGGEPTLPGLGRFRKGPDGNLQFEREKGLRHD